MPCLAARLCCKLRSKRWTLPPLLAQATLEGTDRQVFSDLLAFARESHQGPEAAAQLARDGYNRQGS